MRAGTMNLTPCNPCDIILLTMSRKKVDFDKDGISELPNNQPVVYKIFNKKDENVYTGIAGRGNVQDRLQDHLPGAQDHIPGVKVQIEQMPSIKDAREKESNIISRTKPKHNKQGK